MDVVAHFVKSLGEWKKHGNLDWGRERDGDLSLWNAFFVSLQDIQFFFFHPLKGNHQNCEAFGLSGTEWHQTAPITLLTAPATHPWFRVFDRVIVSPSCIVVNLPAMVFAKRAEVDLAYVKDIGKIPTQSSLSVGNAGRLRTTVT